MNKHSESRWLALVYAAAVFTSAFLLFQVQPLITKHILPWFGGGAAVWTTCLLFFQTALFLGYAYAHLIHSRLSPRRQALVHGALIAAAVAMLGILPAASWQPGGDENPLTRILLILSISVGLPSFVLSATGPLLQAWFARAFPGRSPYRLYALSNLGSLLALVSYPFIVEPLLPLPNQASLWSAAFVVFALLCIAIAWNRSRVALRRESDFQTEPPMDVEHRSTSAANPETPAPAGDAPPTVVQRLLWLLLPACGAITLMATTNHVSTDIAVMPFLWVVPLALYLTTFIIAFDSPAWYRPAAFAAFTIAAIYATALVHQNNVGRMKLSEIGVLGRLYSDLTATPNKPSHEEPEFRIGASTFLAVNFAAMFGICMLCHGELFRRRPHPRYLTVFYLMIAAGGALGGAFVTLLAPRLFRTYLEWELSLLVACLFAIAILLRRLVTAAFPDDTSLARPATSSERSPHGRAKRLVTLLLAPLFLLSAAVVLLDLSQFLQRSNDGIIFRHRNFFGTLAVRERNPADPIAHNFLLRHGAIAHGAQYTHASRRHRPATYYTQSSGIGRSMDWYRRNPPPAGLRIGVLGLGIGTLAAYAEPSYAVTFYEINPAVVKIAENERWFTYLLDCRARGATCKVKLGDGRLTLERELTADASPGSERLGEAHPARFHLLVLDAFSGDSVPAHLLTAEAFEIYLAHLDANAGAIAVNISNRYLDLEPVVRGIAEHYQLQMVHIHNRKSSLDGSYSADWIILTRNQPLLEHLRWSERVPTEKPKPPILWTDTHSSLFEIPK